jgi:hypothetical protein
MSSSTNYSSATIISPVVQEGQEVGTTPTAVHLSARQLLVLVFFLIIFTGAARPIGDPDFWWHLKTGQLLVQTRAIPHSDIFSSLHFGKEWVAHEWLSEIIMYSVYRSLAYGGLIVLFALVITAAFLVAYRRYRQRVGHPYIAGFALLLGAFATMPTWGVRPQMFSLLFASIFLAILDNYTRNGRKRCLWWLVPLTVCWVNMHAGFALGICLILLTIVGLGAESFLSRGEPLKIVWRIIRPLSVILFVCLAVVMVNPNGIRIYSYPFETLNSHAMMKYIGEWSSPDFHEPMFQPLALLIFSTFGALALSRKRVSLRELLLLVATGVAALRSGRNVPFFALVAIPLLAEHSWDWINGQRWGQWLTRPEKREAGKNAAIKVTLNIALLVVVPLGMVLTRVAKSASNQPLVNSQQFPAAAVDYLTSQELPQPIYNEYGWGGYLIWRLYPNYRVYIDGRADVYGDTFLEEFLMVHSGETRWQETLNRYGIRTVLVKPDAAIASLLRQDAGWQKVFEDSQAVIFVKR